MRMRSKPSTAFCTLEHCTAFLLAESQSTGGVRLAEVSGGEFAHDAADRFHSREQFTPGDLFDFPWASVLQAGACNVAAHKRKP